MLETLIQRQDEDLNFLQSVSRAMTTSDPRSTTPDSRGRIQDYHKIDYSDFLSVANTEHTPISASISRKEMARDIVHFWFEQYYPTTYRAATDAAPTPVDEVSDPTDTAMLKPTRFSNVMNKIGRTFVISDELLVIAQAGGLLEAVGRDEWGRQMQFNMTMLLRQQELSILKASINSSGTGIRQMRGLMGDYLAVGNGTTYSTPKENGWWGSGTPDGTDNKPVEERTAFDQGGKELIASGTPSGTQVLIETVLNSALQSFYNLYAGPTPPVLYVPPRTIPLLQKAAASKVQVFMTQAELSQRTEQNLGGVTGKYLSDFGMIDFVAHPLLFAHNSGTDDVSNGSTAAARNSRFLFLDLSQIALVDYAGFGGIHIEPRAKTAPVENRVMYEIFTLEVRQILSHGLVKNFWHA